MPFIGKNVANTVVRNKLFKIAFLCRRFWAEMNAARKILHIIKAGSHLHPLLRNADLSIDLATKKPDSSAMEKIIFVTTQN